jgi:hypothetical protein
MTASGDATDADAAKVDAARGVPASAGVSAARRVCNSGLEC